MSRVAGPSSYLTRETWFGGASKVPRLPRTRTGGWCMKMFGSTGRPGTNRCALPACLVASFPPLAITKCGTTPRFIFLWTGKYDYRSPTSWDADRPRYEAQMEELKTWVG